MNSKHLVVTLTAILCGALLIAYPQSLPLNEEFPDDDIGYPAAEVGAEEVPLEGLEKPSYEEDLERMIEKVSPLFEILSRESRVVKKRSDDAQEQGRGSRYNAWNRMGYGGSYGGSYGDYGQSYGGCCSSSSLNDLLPLLALTALSLLLLYLIVLATTTSAAGKRRRRSQGGLLNDPLSNDVEWEDNLGSEFETVYLDGPAWLSLVHELWEQDGAVEDTSCAQHTLCRMNNLAMSAPGQAGWAVSLSSLPLSYLLHRRHDGGFTSYLDAALMGRSGANCTLIYSNCPRLHYNGL